MGWGDSSAGKSRLPCEQEDMYLKPRIYEVRHDGIHL